MLEALPGLSVREQIERAQALMLAVEASGEMIEVEGELLAPIVLETWHQFADGLVARTILIPSGCRLVGAAHKAEHLNIASGDITVWTDDGMRRITGPHTVISSRPGAKRIGHAHADTYWTTVHLNPTNERDLDKIEDALTDEAHLLQRRRLAALPGRAPTEALS